MPKMMADGSSPSAGIGPEGQPELPRPLAERDRVMIYEDPITREKPEGYAILIERQPGDLEEEWQRWIVMFQPDHEMCHRWVHVDDRTG